MAIGEEPKVTNAMKAVGQGVEQEAPDELVGLQTHGLYGAVGAIVLPGEPDVFVVAGLDAAVGDGDAMGVAAEIGENLRGSAEGLLGVDDPIEATHGSQMCGERGGISQIGETAEESEAVRVEGGLQAFEEQAAEQSLISHDIAARQWHRSHLLHISLVRSKSTKKCLRRQLW
jgi:hypothetical protein